MQRRAAGGEDVAAVGEVAPGSATTGCGAGRHHTGDSEMGTDWFPPLAPTGPPQRKRPRFTGPFQ